MSSQKGNSARTRAQKHQNRTAFKNNLNDTSNRTKMINSIQVSGVCTRCKEIIEWKIKYKKYKPLTQPKTCVKCNLKKVKQAYHTLCGDCGKELKVCTKCQSKETVSEQIEEEPHKLDSELKNIIKTLPERKRRTFLRYLNKPGAGEDNNKSKDELMSKLNELQIDDKSDDEFDCYENEDSDLENCD